MRTWSLFSVFALFISFQTSADGLEQTQAMLTNPAERGLVISKDPKAKEADASMRRLGLSSESNEKVYHLSGQIFESMVKDTKGDPNKLQEKIQAYQRDPASLEKDLTPEQKKQLKDLSLQVPGQESNRSH